MGRRALLLLLPLALTAGCSRPTALFVEQNARAHVEMLAESIGSRAAGSPANASARAYIVDQLKLFGYDVRVQETDARRSDLGRTARVANIIGILPGQRREGIGLVSHYDSRADTPGAGDDAFGVAVSLEAARVLAARTDRQWTTFVLVTDAEEHGLMGAAALMNDSEVRDHLAAYINLEAVGTSGPSVLFQTGPANAWIVGPWARSAPNPRGGSYAIEIYNRLPNDTDFSILARHQVPGLNFAIIGNSQAYHTARDTSARVSGRVLRDTGENVVAIVADMQSRDITARSAAEATYFDIGGTAALTYSARTAWILSLLALVLGAAAWFRVTRFLVAQEGAGRWLLGFAWTIFGAVVSTGAMVLASWALRASRESYHPWYAYPDRFFLLLLATGAATAWMMARAGRWIPARARGVRHPAVAWTYALPVWMVLAALIAWIAPSAAYLWTLPLLAAGVMLVLPGMSNAVVARTASVVILAVTATLWLRDTVDLLRFMVGILGRQPVITPIYVYAALIAAAGIMLAPPLFAVMASPRPLLHPSALTAVLLAAVAITGVSAWLAPAYTHERPLRRYARAIQEPGAAASLWEIGSLEPGLDLADGAPGGWSTSRPPVTSVPWPPIAQPFVFATTAQPLGEAPVDVREFIIGTVAESGGATLSLSLLPRAPGVGVAFVLPEGITPARSNLPGVVRAGRWIATFAAAPAEGIAWQAAFNRMPAEKLREVRVAVTTNGFPGGSGWQRLPAWMPQDRAVWSAFSTWVLDPSVPKPIEPVPPLK